MVALNVFPTSQTIRPSAILVRLKILLELVTMEVNLIRRTIDDLSERSTALRGFL